ncbi:MAG: beta strand repeat-containing protein [Brevundimonas sp.]|uniref:beta strand repeat-containing protein n=1 Tax=Brevundimonas sp. TaxID=1871086 RepID=UPI00391D6A36
MTKRKMTVTKVARARTSGVRNALMLSAGALALVAAAPALAQVPGVDALPGGGQIVGGTGTIHDPAGNHLQIDQASDRLLINWDSFDIGQNASVDFAQQNGPQSIAVNRVTGSGAAPSLIFGQLSADGTVVVINGNGVVFGGTANVDVGRLVATTSDVSDAEFMSGGDLRFSGLSSDTGAVSILSGANITVADAGLAAFVAPRVSNAGVITARGGRVVLASGVDYTLDLAGDGLIEFSLGADSPLVTQAGEILARGGLVQISAAAAAGLISDVINVSGEITVTSIDLDHGVIVLSAGEGDGGGINVSSELAISGDIEVEGRRIHGAGDIEVNDGALVQSVNAGGADTTGETLIADALGVIGDVDGGTTVNLGHGLYAAGASVAASNVTIDGGGVATIGVDGTPLAGLTIGGDNVTVRNLAIDGPVSGDHREIDWAAELSTVGIVVSNGAENATITDNEITNIRTGIRLHGGGNAGAEVAGNYIENTKGAILVQYTDGAGLDILGNTQGPLGNEWGIVLNLNTGAPLAQHASAGAQSNIMALSDGNNGMAVLDRAYAWSNRSHVSVDDDSSVTPADDFNYGNGLGNERQALHTVQAGVIAVAAGGHVNIRAGDYAGLVSIDKSVTLSGAGVDGTHLTGGISLSNTAFSDLTLKDFTLSGDGGGNALVRNGRVTNLTVDGVRFDGGNVAGRHGFAGGQFGGAISITNSEFLDIRGWSAFDTSTGGTATAITSVVFSGNVLDGTVGHVTFRQATPTAHVLISDNIVGNVGDTTDLSSGIFKVFGAATVDFIGNQITGIGASPTKLTAGVNDGAALLVRGVGTLNITDNRFTDNQQALLVGAGNALPTVTNITGNTFTNNARDLFLPASAGGTINFGAGNDFISGADTVAHLTWVGATALDMTGVMFNGELGSAMSDAELFALEARIHHGVDQTGVGRVSVVDGHLFVTQGSGVDAALRALALADSGDTLNLSAGTHTLTNTLFIQDDSITVAGQGQGQTILDASGHGAYGVRVHGDDVSLSGFTLNGSAAATNASYGVKVEAASGTGASGRNTGFSIADVTINGSRKTGLDLNSVLDVLIDGVTVSGVIAGNGIAITDSAGVTIRDTSTSGNAWGGLALYQRNNFSDQQLTDITVEASNSFGEVNGVYLQQYASALHQADDLTIEGFDFVVQNGQQDGGATSYAWFQKTQQGAIDFAVNVANTNASIVNGWSGSDATGTFTVGIGNLNGGGTRAMSIAGAVNAAGDGDTVRVLGGTYALSSTLNIDQSLSLIGAGQGQTLIDGSAVNSYGMLVNADDVSLSGFTFQGNNSTSSGHYGVKVQPDTGAAGDRVLDFALSDVTIRGWGGSELDLNGVIRATITNVTVDGQGTKGVGVGITDSADVTLSGVTTINNLWGAVALYQTNRFYDQQLTDIHIDAGDNSFGELLGVFAQSYSGIGLEIGDLYLTGFDFTVVNPDHRADGDDYTFFRTSLDDAIDFAVNLNPTESDASLVQGFDGSDGTGHYYVGVGELIGGGTQALSIQTAFDGSTTDDTVHIAAGDYAETLTLNGRRAVQFDAVGVDGLTIAAGAGGSSLAGDLTAGAGGLAFAAAVVLAGDLGLTTTDGGVIDLALVDGATVGGQSLTLVGSGDVTLQAIGSVTGLASLDVTGVSITSAAAATTGAQRFSADDIRLAGDYQAGDAFTANGAVELTGDVSISGAALEVALGTVDGAQDLSINADSVSLARVGGTTALGDLSIVSAAILTAGATTTGDQTYSGPVTLNGAFQAAGFSADAARLGGDVSIAATDANLGGVDGAHALDIDADTVSLGATGAATALASLTLAASSIDMVEGAVVSGAASLTGAANLGGAFEAGSLNAGAVRLADDLSIDADGAVTLGAIDGGHGLVVNGGAVILGAVGSTDALTSLDVTGTTIRTVGATTTGGQSYLGALTLAGAYAASNVVTSGATTLTGDTAIGATGGVALGAVDGAHDLSIDAANVSLARVGGTTALGDLSIVSAAILTAGATTTGDQTYGGPITLNGAYQAAGFSADAARLGGDVSIAATGANLGGVDGAHALDIDADTVSLGATGATTALASLTVEASAIDMVDGVVVSGAMSLTGAANLGGVFEVDSMNAGAVRLADDLSIDADGAVTLGAIDGGHGLVVNGGAVILGAVGSTDALTRLEGTGTTIVTAGAATTGVQSYLGALTLAGAYAASDFWATGPATLAGDAAIGTSGDTTLASVNGGHDLSIDAGGLATLGAVGATAALDSLSVTGASIRTNGAVTTGGQTYSGAVNFAGDYRLTGAGDFNAAGVATLTGDTLIDTADGDILLGSVNGATAGGQSLTLDAGGGDATVGDFGAQVRLGAVSVHAARTVLQGSVYAGDSLRFTGDQGATVRLTRASTTFDTTRSPNAAGDITIQPHLIGTTSGGQGVFFIAGNGLSSGASGDITLGDAGTDAVRLGVMTVTGDNFSAATVKVADDYTALLAGDQVFTDQTLDTRGDVVMTIGGDESGSIVALGSVFIDAGGSSTGSLTAGGPVNASYGAGSDRVIIGGGPVNLSSTGGVIGGSITSGGAVNVSGGSTVSTIIVAQGNVDITTNGSITSNVTTPDTVTLDAGQLVQVTVDAGSVVVNAPGGTVEGVFTDISTPGNGTFLVNGEAVVGDGAATARQILTDSFLAPIGGVVGPNGQIELPVGLAIALIAPAGEGAGQRRPIIVNDIERLGELLRLGYTAIVVQIEEGDEPAFEQELDLAQGEDASAAG